MATVEVKLKPYQDEYLFSARKFPLLKAAVGTGKTYMLLLKVWTHCEEYPGSVAMIVRKEYTDLRDSTIKDFSRYFGVEPDSNKEYKFPNGSIILFRHASELNVLKNISLSIVGIEQAEEFPTDEVFTFLRDRMRHPIGTRQICLIANANGHNWLWRRWKNNPSSAEYHIIEATTFDNADNLPADFIADKRALETESPAHYRQYVMNSDEEAGGDDVLLTGDMVFRAPKVEVLRGSPSYRRRILGVDVARFGEDETVYTIIETYGSRKWEQIYLDGRNREDTMQTVGRIISVAQDMECDLIVADEGGVGGGVIDRLREMGKSIKAFDGSRESAFKERFGNTRSAGYFRLRELLSAGHLRLLDDPIQADQLLTIRYRFRSSGQRYIVSKDELRKEGIKSPDRADALMMAVSAVDDAIDRRGEDTHTRYPAYAQENDVLPDALPAYA